MGAPFVLEGGRIPKYRAGDYVEWEAELGIYCGMIKAVTVQHSVLGGIELWYRINEHDVPEQFVKARLIREEYANPEQQELTE
jgi:hypothetical protein